MADVKSFPLWDSNNLLEALFLLRMCRSIVYPVYQTAWGGTGIAAFHLILSQGFFIIVTKMFIHQQCAKYVFHMPGASTLFEMCNRAAADSDMFINIKQIIFLRDNIMWTQELFMVWTLYKLHY